MKEQKGFILPKEIFSFSKEMSDFEKLLSDRWFKNIYAYVTQIMQKVGEPLSIEENGAYRKLAGTQYRFCIKYTKVKPEDGIYSDFCDLIFRDGDENTFEIKVDIFLNGNSGYELPKGLEQLDLPSQERLLISVLKALSKHKRTHFDLKSILMGFY